MQEWFTAQELADLKLPGFPASKVGVLDWFKARDYDAKFPAKTRRRQGRGGGTERHISLLPKGLQSLLTLRHLKTAEAPPLEEIFSGAANIPEPPANEAAELRRDAILLVLNFWDIFRAKFIGSEETARHLFCTMYSNGRIDGIPAWVRGALTTNAGRERGFCANTLRGWETKRDKGDFGALAGAYGNRAGTGVLDTAEDGKVAAYLAALIVKNPHFTADHLRDQVIDRFGDVLNTVSAKTGEIKPAAVPPHRTFQRWVAKWRDDHQDALMKLTDPDSWKNKRRFSGRHMNAWVRRPNQLWEADASPADALLVDGRYAIYAVVDIYTRRMKVLVTKTPRTEAMLMLLRRCILEWGVPEILRTDNGSDFTSHEFKRSVTALGIHHDISDPFSPEQKGTVERHIGTIQRGLMPLLPGYIGHSVADRKQIEARKSFAQRLGESDKKAFCVELTHEAMQAAVDKWVDDKYSHAPHAGLGGKTPFQVMAEWNGPIRRIENERALDLMLAPIAGKDGLRTVTKFGITVDKARFMHPDLIPGMTVLCRHDADDMGRLYVYSEDGRTFVCVAECPERLGINPGAAVRAVREAQAERLKTEVEPLQRDIRGMKPRHAIDSVLRVAAASSANVTAFPKPTETYTTPALEAASEALAPPAAPAPMGDVVARHHEALVAELASPNVAVLPESPKQKFARMWKAQQRMEGGEALDPDEARELLLYVTTSEYRVHKDMFEDFGPAWLQG